MANDTEIPSTTVHDCWGGGTRSKLLGGHVGGSTCCGCRQLRWQFLAKECADFRH